MRIVLCGSSKLKKDILEIANILMKKHEVIVPKELLVTNLTKKELSLLHFDEIANRNTDAVLIVNTPKNNIADYIGPNTFAEIAIAFYFDKNIYLLNGYYELYIDELLGWGVIPLYNSLDKFIK